MVDGLSVQAGLEQEEFDPERPLKTFMFLMANSLARLEELAAGQGSGNEAHGDSEEPQATGTPEEVSRVSQV